MKETIEILIEANSAGMQIQLKKSGDTIQTFVSKMNEGSINWQKILTEGISDAVLVGIAGTFAEALASSIDFNNALVNSSNNSSQAFTSNLQSAAQSAISTSNATGQSASDVVDAYAYASTALNDYAAGHALVDEAAKISTATGLNLMDVVKASTDAMQQWQVPTSDVASALQTLYGESLQGKVGFMQLLDSMSTTGPMLNAISTIQDAGATIEGLSTQTGMTAKSATEFFNGMTTSLDNQADATKGATFGLGGLQKQQELIKNLGLSGYFSTLEGNMKTMGADTASILAQHAGFSPDVVQNIIAADVAYQDLQGRVADIARNAPALGKSAEGNLSSATKLSQVWTRIKNDVMEIFGPVTMKALEVFTTNMNAIATVLDGIAAAFQPGLMQDDALNKSPSRGVAADSTALMIGNPTFPKGSFDSLASNKSSPSGNTTNIVNSNNTTTNNKLGSGSSDDGHGVLTIAIDMKKMSYNSIYQ